MSISYNLYLTQMNSSVKRVTRCKQHNYANTFRVSYFEKKTACLIGSLWGPSVCMSVRLSIPFICCFTVSIIWLNFIHLNSVYQVWNLSNGRWLHSFVPYKGVNLLGMPLRSPFFQIFRGISCWVTELIAFFRGATAKKWTY